MDKKKIWKEKSKLTPSFPKGSKYLTRVRSSTLLTSVIGSLKNTLMGPFAEKLSSQYQTRQIC